MPEVTAAQGAEREEARRLVEAHLPGRSDDAEAACELGHSLYRNGDAPAALKALAHAVALSPASVEIRLTQLRVAANSEDRPGGAALAEDALRALPDNPRVAHFAARALRKNRGFARAAEVWRGVARSNPADPAPLIDAAGCLIRAKDHAGALACAAQAIERDPASLEAQTIRIEALKGMHRPEALGAAVEGLAALDPAKALEHLPSLMAAGRYGVVAAVLRRCRAQGVPFDPRLVAPLSRILRNVAQLAEAEGRFHDASLLWKALSEADATDSLVEEAFRRCAAQLLQTGEEAAQGGHDAEAIEAYRTILSVEPDEPRAARGLAGLLTKSGAWQDAAEAWLACAAGSSGRERADAALQAAMLAGKLDRPPAALTFLTRARDLSTKDASIRGWGVAAAKRCTLALADGTKFGRLPVAVESAVALRGWQPDDAKLARMTRRLVAELQAQMRSAAQGGDAQAAAALGHLTLQVDADHVAALKALADHALKAHRYAEAAERYERLTLLEPVQTRHLEKLVQSYRNLRDAAKGIDACRRLLRLEPDHVQARERLAELTARSVDKPRDGQASAV